MAIGHIEDTGRLHTGQTGPTHISLRDELDTNPIDLTGCAARMIFNYAGADPHYAGHVQIVDAVNGLLVYDKTGAETPTPGQLTGRLELLDPGSIDQATEEWVVWGMKSGGKPVSFKWKVVESA